MNKVNKTNFWYTLLFISIIFSYFFSEDTLGGAKLVSISEANSVVRCLKVMGDVSMLMGILGTILGTVILLQNFQQITDIGPSIAVAAVTLIYGTFFKLLCYVAEQRLRNLYLN